MKAGNALDFSCKCFSFLSFRVQGAQTSGGFHLHLLVFPSLYQLNSRIGVLVNSSFANDKFRRISTSVQNLFAVIVL